MNLASKRDFCIAQSYVYVEYFFCSENLNSANDSFANASAADEELLDEYEDEVLLTATKNVDVFLRIPLNVHPSIG